MERFLVGEVLKRFWRDFGKMLERFWRDFGKMLEEFWTDFGSDDVQLGYLIKKNNFQVMELPFQFNHMTMYSEAWNGFPNRFD